MAFRVPMQAAAPNRSRAAYAQHNQQLSTDLLAAESLRQQGEDDTREWVLFSPSQAAFSSRSRSDVTKLTSKTTGASRLSDFGSFNDRPLSRDGDLGADEQSVETLEDGVTEADSLDEAFQAFRENNIITTQENDSNWEQSHPVLPAHDGLGSFHVSGQQVQEHILRHELSNQLRPTNSLQARRLSVQRHLDTVHEMESIDSEHERWNRIEKWRLEQSKILLKEIEKETTRTQRRGSRVSQATREQASQIVDVEDIEGVTRILSHVTNRTSSPSTASTLKQDEEDNIEPLWRRITRKVIRDLIGIDDTILSVILGESFIEAHGTSHSEHSQSSNSPSHPEWMADRDMANTTTLTSHTHSWQERLLQRIARELGVLVHQIFEQPGLFNTPRLPSDRPADYYAGIPVSRRNNGSASTTAAHSSLYPLSNSTIDPLSSSQPLNFVPTLAEATTAEHAAEWGIEEDNTPGRHLNHHGPSVEDPQSEPAHLERELEYWEHELDIMVAFRYLRNRFRRSSGGNAGTDSHSTINRRGSHGTLSASQQDGFSRRAAVIRQHHPLVARAHAQQSQNQRRFHLHYAQSHGQGASISATSNSSPIARHRFNRPPGSSCASQSTKISNVRRPTLAGLGSGSSRNYWDIGGSIGSGSVTHSFGGVGVWGEV
jgi:hypothetical protein